MIIVGDGVVGVKRTPQGIVSVATFIGVIIAIAIDTDNLIFILGVRSYARVILFVVYHVLSVLEKSYRIPAFFVSVKKQIYEVEVNSLKVMWMMYHGDY